MDKLISIVLADDHPLFREGVARTLSAENDMEVTGQAGDADEAIELAKKPAPRSYIARHQHAGQRHRSGSQISLIRVAIGKQNFASDESGIESAYELDQREVRFDKQGTDGDDVIRVDYKRKAMTIAVSTELEAHGRYIDLYAATKIAGAELAAAYQINKATPTSDSVDTWGRQPQLHPGRSNSGV